MAQVFVSYARDDAGRAKALALAIERAGYSVWWDRELVGGAEYSREIDDALKAADAVIVLWSKQSVGSAWVRDEAAAGRDTGRLVPARLDSSEVPLGFRQYQTIDLSRWNGRGESAGIKALKAALAVKIGRVRPEGTAGDNVPAGTARRPSLRTGPWIAAALAVAAAIAGYLLLGPGRRGEVPAVAVIAADAGGQNFARNLTVDLGSLKATAADSFELRNANDDPAEIDYFVRVATTRQGRLAVADLTLNSRDDPQILWTGRYEQDDGDSSALQQQAATRLATLLNCLGEARPPAGERLDDDSTLKLYLRGCTRLDDIIMASAASDLISLFRQVTERAPRFAPAWVGLAYLEANSTTIGQSAANPSSERVAREYVERARQLNPNLGMIYFIEGDLVPNHRWEDRMAIFERGLAKDPDTADLHAAMSIELRQVGRVNDAVDSAVKAAKLDPLSPRVQAAVVPILAAAGRFAEAREYLAAAERRWPDAPAVIDARYAYELRYGDAAKALALLRGGMVRPMSILARTAVPNPAVELFLEARIDPSHAKIDAAVAAYRDRYRRDPSTIDVTSLVMLGQVDLAYAALKNPVVFKAMSAAPGVFFRINMREFRNDRRFMPLVARYGLVRYWQKTGKWPDFCLEADLPYECKAEAAKLTRA